MAWKFTSRHPLVRQYTHRAKRDPSLTIVATIERRWANDVFGPVRSYEVTVAGSRRTSRLLITAQVIAYRMISVEQRRLVAGYNGSTCTNPWIPFCDCAACRDAERKR